MPEDTTVTEQQCTSRVLAAPSYPDTVSALATIGAFLQLIYVDVALHMLGYKFLRRRLCAFNATPRTNDFSSTSAIVTTVDHALVFYPRTVMCLQRSLVITWLLRKRGIQANLVIGYTHLPFKSHAWVEVGGMVVNDLPSLTATFIEIERI